MKPDGSAKNGFKHLINSGAAALDGNGTMKDKNGNSVMKQYGEKDRLYVATCGRLAR